jgi:hypothetical protein
MGKKNDHTKNAHRAQMTTGDRVLEQSLSSRSTIEDHRFELQGILVRFREHY